jgi:hypothetical protein
MGLRTSILFLHATVAGLGWASANLLFYAILRPEGRLKRLEEVLRRGEWISFALLLATGSLLVIHNPAVLADTAFRVKVIGASLILLSYVLHLLRQPSLPAGMAWGAWQAFLFIGLLNASFPVPVFFTAFGLFLLCGLVVERAFRHAV